MNFLQLTIPDKHRQPTTIDNAGRLREYMTKRERMFAERLRLAMEIVIDRTHGFPRAQIEQAMGNARCVINSFGTVRGAVSAALGPNWDR